MDGGARAIMVNFSSGVPMSASKSASKLDPSELFVLIDREFRRRTRSCDRCVFSVPFRFRSRRRRGRANWSVIPSEACSPTCRFILDDVVSEHQAAYDIRD